VALLARKSAIELGIPSLDRRTQKNLPREGEKEGDAAGEHAAGNGEVDNSAAQDNIIISISYFDSKGGEE